MSFGIQPKEIEEMSMYEIDIYTRLIPLYHEFSRNQMENAIKKSLSELFNG